MGKQVVQVSGVGELNAASHNRQERFDKINSQLVSELKDAGHCKFMDKLFCSPDCDIDSSFLGFVDCYAYLSNLIPLDRVIYDMGCCYGMQAWFFRDHYKYVGVDALTTTEYQLQLSNTEYHHTTIEKFLKTAVIEDPHFAICNYVPPWGADNEKLVRERFRHLFVYYPESRSELCLR